MVPWVGLQSVILVFSLTLLLHANNKGATSLSIILLGSLISAIVICSLEGVINKFASCKILIF